MMIQMDTQDTAFVKRVRLLIRKKFGPDAELVFGEAKNNVQEHSSEKVADMVFHATGFSIETPIAPESLVTEKPEGLGGYGMGIIAALGGVVEMGRGIKVKWTRPA